MGYRLRRQGTDVEGAQIDVDTATLDELLRDNQRVEALRIIMEDLREHRIHLRAGDERAADEDRVALSRIMGILADDWTG